MSVVSNRHFCQCMWYVWYSRNKCSYFFQRGIYQRVEAHLSSKGSTIYIKISCSFLTVLLLGRHLELFKKICIIINILMWYQRNYICMVLYCGFLKKYIWKKYYCTLVLSKCFNQFFFVKISYEFYILKTKYQRRIQYCFLD